MLSLDTENVDISYLVFRICHVKLIICTIMLHFITGERRIRVHTLALPVTNKLQDVYANADPQAIVTLLSKMG